MCETHRFDDGKFCNECGRAMKNNQTECIGCRCINKVIDNEGNASNTRKNRAKKHLKYVSIPARLWVKEALRYDD